MVVRPPLLWPRYPPSGHRAHPAYAETETAHRGPRAGCGRPPNGAGARAVSGTLAPGSPADPGMSGHHFARRQRRHRVARAWDRDHSDLVSRGLTSTAAAALTHPCRRAARVPIHKANVEEVARSGLGRSAPHAPIKQLQAVETRVHAHPRRQRALADIATVPPRPGQSGHTLGKPRQARGRRTALLWWSPSRGPVRVSLGWLPSARWPSAGTRDRSVHPTAGPPLLPTWTSRRQWRRSGLRWQVASGARAPRLARAMHAAGFRQCRCGHLGPA